MTTALPHAHSLRWRPPLFPSTLCSRAIGPRQVSYFKDYTEQMRLSRAEDQIDIRGYFGWALLDNYEWSDGYSKRFGLFFVDYVTQQRTPKAAAKWFRGMSHPTCP